MLAEAKVRFPLFREAPRATGAPLLARMNPLNPWKAKLLLETPIGGVNRSELTGAYCL